VKNLTIFNQLRWLVRLRRTHAILILNKRDTLDAVKIFVYRHHQAR